VSFDILIRHEHSVADTGGPGRGQSTVLLIQFL